ncbi:DUF3549 family protein [Parashewanella spongiae]|uniref:DUF3549 family protein n=1 Tax=Parashewanella spongiae TaxID=342950 RepID=A0A3A6TYA3_9GAMM|nr:DUF3549 family protein [Parashewanella spongiae]MCL1076747.1 DUF3549 family protein [Parashewanella spongiae]RJY19489.1 DUF3549 family protein [Parashewanella spongiae]
MTEINTLTQFLTTAQTQFQIYDLGRKVQHIDMMTFSKIESLESPYPFPIQGHAQFAIVFWNQEKQPYIWFVKLALDEQGLLLPSARSQFIQMILEALGRDPTQHLSEQQQQALANNPFSFKPTQEKLAVFNALVRKQLNLPASSQYETAVQYLSGQIAKENWQDVGLQGIADICIRYNQLNHENYLMSGLETAALEVKIALCQCLENISISEKLADRLLTQFYSADNEYQLYFFRALSSHFASSSEAFISLSQQNKLSDSALITIAARNWSLLRDDELRTIFLEALAHQSQHFFNQVFADIVAIPSLRHKVLAELRNPDRSNQLSQAIGGLFKATS